MSEKEKKSPLGYKDQPNIVDYFDLVEYDGENEEFAKSILNALSDRPYPHISRTLEDNGFFTLHLRVHEVSVAHQYDSPVKLEKVVIHLAAPSPVEKKDVLAEIPPSGLVSVSISVGKVETEEEKKHAKAKEEERKTFLGDVKKRAENLLHKEEHVASDADVEEKRPEKPFEASDDQFKGKPRIEFEIPAEYARATWITVTFHGLPGESFKIYSVQLTGKVLDGKQPVWNWEEAKRQIENKVGETPAAKPRLIEKILPKSRRASGVAEKKKEETELEAVEATETKHDVESGEAKKEDQKESGEAKSEEKKEEKKEFRDTPADRAKAVSRFRGFTRTLAFSEIVKKVFDSVDLADTEENSQLDFVGACVGWYLLLPDKPKDQMGSFDRFGVIPAERAVQKDQIITLSELSKKFSQTFSTPVNHRWTLRYNPPASEDEQYTINLELLSGTYPVMAVVRLDDSAGSNPPLIKNIMFSTYNEREAFEYKLIPKIEKLEVSILVPESDPKLTLIQFLQADHEKKMASKRGSLEEYEDDEIKLLSFQWRLMELVDLYRRLVGLASHHLVPTKTDSSSSSSSSSSSLLLHEHNFVKHDGNIACETCHRWESSTTVAPNGAGTFKCAECSLYICGNCHPEKSNPDKLRLRMFDSLTLEWPKLDETPEELGVWQQIKSFLKFAMAILLFPIWFGACISGIVSWAFAGALMPKDCGCNYKGPFGCLIILITTGLFFAVWGVAIAVGYGAFSCLGLFTQAYHNNPDTTVIFFEGIGPPLFLMVWLAIDWERLKGSVLKDLGFFDDWFPKENPLSNEIILGVRNKFLNAKVRMLKKKNVKATLSLDRIVNDLNQKNCDLLDIGEPNRYTAVGLFLTALLHALLPGIVRASYGHPFLGETGVEKSIAVLNLLLSWPLLLRIIWVLCQQVYAWHYHLEAYNRVTWLASSKEASEHQDEMDYWMDLAEDHNAFSWLAVRDQIYQERQEKDRATFMLGPALVVDLALILTIVIRVYVDSVTFDNLNIVAAYDALVFTLLMVAFIPYGIKINETITSDHIEVVRKRREKLLREYSIVESRLHQSPDDDDEVSVGDAWTSPKLKARLLLEQKSLDGEKAPKESLSYSENREKFKVIKSKIFVLDYLVGELRDRGDSEDLNILGFKFNDDLQTTLVGGLTTLAITGLSKILANFGIPMPFAGGD